MENSEESTSKKTPRKATALLENRIRELECELAQANEVVRNKEYLVKIQADQLRKFEDMHKDSLNEIEMLSYTNRKAVHDLENMKLLLIGYEKSRKQMINVECQAVFENQELTAFNSTNYQTVLKQQDRMLNAIFTLNNGCKSLTLKESHTQCNLLPSDKSKMVDVLEAELNILRAQIDKFHQIPEFLIEDTEEKITEIDNCKLFHQNSAIRSEITRSSSDSSIYQSVCYSDHFPRPLSPVPEREECNERVNLLEEECDLLRKSLEKVKKSFLMNKNMLSDAQLKISKFDFDAEHLRMKNEKLECQLRDFKRQFSTLVIKIDTAMGKVKRYEETWMSQSNESLNMELVETVNINDYFTNFLEVVNQTKSEKDALYNTLLEHQKNSERNLNELSQENSMLKKKIGFLTQQIRDDHNLIQEYTNFKTTFEEQTKETKNNKTVYKNKGTNIESTKDVIIDELNHLATLAGGEEETNISRVSFSELRLSTAVRKICGKLKACYQVQINEIKILRAKVEHLEHKRDELVKVNNILSEECKESSRDKEICVKEINSLLHSLKLEEKLVLDYTCKGDDFENQLKQVCMKLKNYPGGDYEEFDRLRNSEHQYAMTMEATAKEIIQLMVFLGYKDGVSCYNFTDKNMVHQVKTICTKIKVWYTKQVDSFKEQQHDLLKQIDESKKCGNLVKLLESKTNTSAVLESFVRETNYWLKQLKTKRITIDYDHMETIDLQMRKGFAELQTAVEAHAVDLEKDNFELIQLNENLIKEVEELKNNSTVEVLENKVMKEMLELMDVFDICGGVLAKVDYTIHNLKDICDQIKSCYHNQLKKEATLERSLEMLKIKQENLLKENNDLNKEIELLRSEEFNQDDVDDLISLTKGKQILMQGCKSKKESLKSIYREIQACFEKGVQEKRIIKHQLEEQRSKQNQLHEENEELKMERGVIQATLSTEINDLMSLLEEPRSFSSEDKIPEQIRLFCAKLRNRFKNQIEKHRQEMEEVNLHRTRCSTVNEMLMKQMRKLMMLIDNKQEHPMVLEEYNANQIEDVCHHLHNSFHKNINEGLESRQMLEAQVEGLRSTVGVLMEQNERLREGKLLKEACLVELNELNKSIVKDEEYIGDIAKVSFVCKRIKANLLEKSKLQQTFKTSFETLVNAIKHQEVSFPAFPFLFDRVNNLEEQLVKAFTALEDIIVSALKLKNTEIADVKEQLKTTTKEFEDLEKAKRGSNNEENLQRIILELRERLQSLENDTDLQKSKFECQVLRENVKKIKDNVYIASSLREKYLELMEKYYKQNSELEMQNECMKEHIFVIREYKRKLKDSEKTVADLRREVASIQSHKNQGEDENMQAEFNRMIGKLEKVMCEKESLQKDVVGLTYANNTLRRDVEERSENVRKMKEEIVKLTEEKQTIKEDSLRMENIIKENELKNFQNGDSNATQLQKALADFEELQKKQEADMVRVVDEKELYKQKLEAFEKTNANLNEVQEELQKALVENEEQKLNLARKDQLQHELNIYKIEINRLNSEVTQLKDEIEILRLENENLNTHPPYDSEMKQTIDECANYKTKLNNLNGKLNKYLEDQTDYQREFECVRNNLIDENTKLRMKLSMCNDILTDFNFVLRSQNIQEQIVSLRVFIKKRDTHIRILLEQKGEACKLLEILIGNSERNQESEMNLHESLSPAVKVAQTVVETLIMNLCEQDEKYNETNCEISNNDRILKEKLKDLENKKNMLKTSLQDLTMSDNVAYGKTQRASPST